MIDLPVHVLRTVASILRGQVQRLEGKIARTGSETSARYDADKVENLAAALVAIEDDLARKLLEEEREDD